jgi:hypothetical protein
MTAPWEAAENAKRQREREDRERLKPFVEIKTLNHMTPALYCQGCRAEVQEVQEISMGTTTAGPPNYFSVILCRRCRYDWAVMFTVALISGEDLNT